MDIQRLYMVTKTRLLKDAGFLLYHASQSAIDLLLQLVSLTAPHRCNVEVTGPETFRTSHARTHPHLMMFSPKVPDPSQFSCSIRPAQAPGYAATR